ncbi:MAG TPA: DNA sulfur modification protein DndB [Archangium sp.]|uniref:DNA sulfur modification protein DndB n=1 Tax=Archangium sp. TaxID=1872627 RepID=UPI002E36B956|nr:DNA sulfur modification protein DndB [Archangium sp.]HEX5747158.1 DNA sulfur modification protein DndB [Archangium sp.]
MRRAPGLSDTSSSGRRSQSPAAFGYVFPAIRGVQAHREFYVSMCPLRLIPRIFLFNEDELVPELRAQRVLNKGRIPEMARYILGNRDSYTFSALTASIDGDVRFEPLGETGDAQKLGSLQVSMHARFVINDGQHRRAAIEAAIRENPDLADETIAVVFFLDTGLERCQQMFADLNRHAIRPSTSLGVLYDHREDGAKVVKHSVLKLPLYRDLTEMERSTLSARSRKLFTLSALYTATRALLARLEDLSDEERRELATAFWDETAKLFPEWQQVLEQKLSAAEVRRDLLHTHGVVLQALGRVGNTLLREQPQAWKKSLKKLSRLDWSRSNAKLWEGRALVGGRVSKAGTHVTLTTNLIKAHLGLLLTPEEQRIEDALLRGEHAAN